MSKPDGWIELWRNVEVNKKNGILDISEDCPRCHGKKKGKRCSIDNCGYSWAGQRQTLGGEYRFAGSCSERCNRGQDIISCNYCEEDGKIHYRGQIIYKGRKHILFFGDGKIRIYDCTVSCTGKSFIVWQEPICGQFSGIDSKEILRCFDCDLRDRKDIPEKTKKIMRDKLVNSAAVSQPNKQPRK